MDRSTLDKIRKDFPILEISSNNHILAYLDNAATTQKPKSVIDCFNKFYNGMNANTHRGIHYLSELATSAFEQSREKVQKYINAKYSHECIFVRGTTEAINLVAHAYGNKFIKKNDSILITQMEHHSNIVPWQMLCERIGAKLKVLPINTTGELVLDNLDDYLVDTKLLAITHISNALGTINPIKKIITEAKKYDIVTLVDGTQAGAHVPINVQDLGCDFYTLSAHKMYGPLGVGVLYGREKLLDEMDPYQTGGNMILSVSLDNKTTFNQLPFKFEAGTPAIAEVIAFGTCIDYLKQLDFNLIAEHEQQLLNYANEKLADIEGLKYIGQAKDKISIVSFVLKDIHPHDIGTISDQFGVAIRTGHHCTMPIMDFYKVPATSRASFAFYNSFEEIDQLYNALHRVKQIFKK